MELVLPTPGTYVIAVSGGVDSMALLHRLAQEPSLRLIVAHYDHGIRGDSDKDRQLVQQTALSYGLPFVYDAGRMGAGTSEATARDARYNFLEQVRQSSQARAIITAHHQDDVLETAILNMLRGTGRKGLTSLASREGVVRPLLQASKRDLRQYAQDQGLVWREDSSNQDEAYLRNYIRHRLLPRFSDQDKKYLLSVSNQLRTTNDEIDTILAGYLRHQTVDGGLDRGWFCELPHSVAREVMAAWLRDHDIRGFDRYTLERLVVAAKVAEAGKQFPVLNNVSVHVRKDTLALGHAER
jgi:tRNA(Ile)-lysidine synthase